MHDQPLGVRRYDPFRRSGAPRQTFPCNMQCIPCNMQPRDNDTAAIPQATLHLWPTRPRPERCAPRQTFPSGSKRIMPITRGSGSALRFAISAGPCACRATARAGPSQRWERRRRRMHTNRPSWMSRTPTRPAGAAAAHACYRLERWMMRARPARRPSGSGGAGYAQSRSECGGDGPGAAGVRLGWGRRACASSRSQASSSSSDGRCAR
jgi:hypothetical protein